MLISEMIEALQEQQNIHGDIEVKVFDVESGITVDIVHVEFNGTEIEIL